ncbi:hypothetical protein N406_04315 [Helicobacter pylori FD577]|nr:hypothetical protein N406_04315 [Helicobacter pylori FD577]
MGRFVVSKKKKRFLGCFETIPTNPLITLKKLPPKSSFFSFCE